MFVRFSTLFSIAALAAVAAALPGNPSESGEGSSNGGPSGSSGSSSGSSGLTSGGECTTSPNNCCDSVESASSPGATYALGVVGIAVDTVDALVGLSCTGLIQGQSCAQQPACCNGNTFEGLVTLDCTPINVGL